MTPERKAELIALSQAHRENPPEPKPFTGRSISGMSPRQQRILGKATKQR